MRSPRDARGHTVIELMLVMSIISILFRIAIPATQSFMRQTRSSAIAADYNAVRDAAIACYDATGEWPAESAQGQVPPELVPYLPRDFTFDRAHYDLDWDRWSVADDTDPGTSHLLLCMTVVTSDAVVGERVSRILAATAPVFEVGDHYSVVVSSTLE